MPRRRKTNSNAQKTLQLNSTKNLNKKSDSTHLQQSHIIGINRKRNLNNNSSNSPSTSTKISNLPNGSLTIVQPSILKNKITDTSKLINAPSNNDNQFKDFIHPSFTETTTSSTNNLNTLNTTSSKKRKQAAKAGKGLRHFSMKVCEKVKMKGVTTYNEVADELVSEFSSNNASLNKGLNSTFQSNVYNDQESFHQKNIRRRVYDALNVLMAMNIISKEKKEIRWIGFPSNSSQECSDLEQEKQDRSKRIKIKKQQLHDLLLQQIAFKNLVERNRNFNLLPTSNAIIGLPFIIVNTDKTTIIDCSISSDKSEYLFNFDNTFEIHDDVEILKRMGLTHGLECENNENIDKDGLEKAKTMLPDALKNELDEIIQKNEVQPLIQDYQIS